MGELHAGFGRRLPSDETHRQIPAQICWSFSRGTTDRHGCGSHWPLVARRGNRGGPQRRITRRSGRAMTDTFVAPTDQELRWRARATSIDGIEVELARIWAQPN